MRVDLNPITVDSAELGSAAQSNGSARAASQPSNPSPGASDTAVISNDQGRVQALAAQANAAPEVRQDKVEALRRGLADGSYEVSPMQTAEAMISEVQAQFAA